MIFLLDNYDSFTFNIYQYVGELGERLTVRRNDDFTVDEVRALGPSAIIISPGPGIPSEAGLSRKVVREFAGEIPVLGVCLGHQAIAEEFGGRIVPAGELMHGKTSAIFHDGKGIYEGIPSPFMATRYHSLIVDKDSLPDCFEVSAYGGDGIIMGIRHRELSLDGVQFHPESVLTGEGKKIFCNFLNLVHGRDLMPADGGKK